LIQVAASQLSDQLPESREAARTLLLELQNVYEKFHDLIPAATVSEDPETKTVSEDPNSETVSEDPKTETASEDPETKTESWENFCHSKLSPLSAQAVLRVTSIAREGLVS
jgi:hypothetical protein